jgi:hypothetical protein
MPWPVQCAANSAIQPRAPSPFDGQWCHSTNAASIILSSGWCPRAVKNTIYGAAVYLSRNPWNLTHSHVFNCVLDLQHSNCQSTYTWVRGTGGTGNDQDAVIWHLGDVTGKSYGRTAGPGTNSQNTQISAYFSSISVKAIHFVEHRDEVVAVYDPSCIYLI